uniref:hypothetical protein n=1 Tax=Nitzschia traheaformis TaxID=1881117 RepID=UPI001EF9D23D|nr:hypothetical protein MKU15_pgp060 [Nitzschia traheaformis]ULD15895.1 hypothetical protein [Nitzschia traheaformis]
MRLTFTPYDVQEISSSAFRAFISTFIYESEESDSGSKSDNSDSELSDFDPEIFGCGEITPEVENIVENTWEICNPLDEVYGATTSNLIKETVQTATEETQCAGLKIFKAITPGKDRNLIETCTEISFWCCCETVKKVSPIIAEATNNLMY